MSVVSIKVQDSAEEDAPYKLGLDASVKAMERGRNVTSSVSTNAVAARRSKMRSVMAEHGRTLDKIHHAISCDFSVNSDEVTSADKIIRMSSMKLAEVKKKLADQRQKDVDHRRIQDFIK